MALRRKFALGAAAAVATTLLLPAASASAAESYDGDADQEVCLQPNQQACIYVAVEGRIGQRYKPDDSTAGAGYLERDPSGLVARVQIDKVVLGTQTGVVATSGSRNSGTKDSVELQGPGVLWSRNCAVSYHVAVYWSARLSNGQLKTGKLLGPYYKSPAC